MPTSSSRRASTTRRGRAVATRTTARVCRGLTALGCAVHEHAVPGAWPRAGEGGHVALARAVRRIPDGALVLLDGLIASTAPEALVPQARRLRQVVLVHMPLGHRPQDDEAGAVRAREREVLTAAAAVVTTSAWTRRRLGELYALPAGRVHVAEPGVDAARLAPGSAAGDALLCVAALTPDKGHDVLLDGLATATDLSWRCVCVGSVVRDLAFTKRMRRRARNSGLRRPGALRRTAHRRGAGRHVRRRGAVRAGLTSARPTAWSSPRLSPAACRSSPPRSVEGPRPLGTGRTAPGRGCWFRPASRRPLAPRCAPGSRMPSCVSTYGARRVSGARRCARGRPPRPWDVLAAIVMSAGGVAGLAGAAR